MKTIKFRIWDKCNERMVEPRNILKICMSRLNQEPYLIVYLKKWMNPNREIREIDKCYTNEFELMQYAGLKDKNGTKIYEGDIIRFHHLEDLPEMAEVAEVVYFGHRDYPAFDLNYHRIKEYYFESNILSEIICSGAYHYEVIGNVFENPELLETEKGGSDGEDHIG